MTARPTLPLPLGELLELKRWNTPSVYNGWEQITHTDPSSEAINIEPTRDLMPQMGPMVGYAATVVIEPSKPTDASDATRRWSEYLEWIAALSGPTIVVVQDLDRPHARGSFWGEINANIHRALGCVGTITDGAIRDVDEMTNAGFHAIARQVCVGHAFVCPIEWNIDVSVFGQTVQSGQLLHADKHGFLAIPRGEEAGLLSATQYMDASESQTLLAAARSNAGQSRSEILADIATATQCFGERVQTRFSGRGEW